MHVLDLILIAFAIAVYPIPLTAFILVIASRNGVRKGAAFIFGWLVSLAIVVSVTLVVTGNRPPKPNTAPSLAALAAKMLLGVVLVVIAVRRWQKMGQPKPPKKTPKWQTGIDHMSVWFAIALGPLTQPWGLIAAGVTVVTDAKLASWLDYLTLILFCFLASATYLATEIYALVKPTQTQAFLTRARAWMDTHTDQVIIIVSLVLGSWLIGRSLYAILT